MWTFGVHVSFGWGVDVQNLTMCHSDKDPESDKTQPTNGFNP